MHTQTLTEWQAEASTRRLVDADVVSASHAHLLSLTIDPSTALSSAHAFPVGSHLPPGYHLALFPPRIREQDLASDGYDTDFSPPSPYVQRMWAGGSFEFERDNPLTIHDHVTQVTTLDDVQLKKGPRGDAAMIWMAKVVENGKGRSVKERRCLAYMPKERNPTLNARTVQITRTPDFQRTFLPTAVTLFRYSALTFNSHRIHYDSIYARELEGYPDCLVHGPLTTTLLMDLLQRNKPEMTMLASFNYRALSPLIVNQPVILCGKQTGEHQYELWAKNQADAIAMKGTALLLPTK